MKWLKRQKFMSHTLGGKEIQGQDAGRSSVWRRPASWIINGCFHIVSSHGGDQTAKTSSLIRALIIREGSTIMT